MGVGTRVLYEDDQIILWEFELAPGEQTAVHTHEHDYLFHVIEGSRLEVLDEAGTSLGAFDAPTGEVFSFTVEDGELKSTRGDGARAPATHSARNVGESHYREVLIEKKG